MSLNERLLLHGAVIRYLHNLGELRGLTTTCWDCVKNLKEVLRVRKLVKEDFDMLSKVSVKDLIQPNIVDDLRGSRANSYTAAVTLVSYLVKRAVHCGVATINTGAIGVGGSMSVWDEFAQQMRFYTKHTVVVMGDFVIDVLHSDKLLKLDSYIDSLDNVDIHFAIENAASCMRAAGLV